MVSAMRVRIMAKKYKTKAYTQSHTQTRCLIMIYRDITINGMNCEIVLINYTYNCLVYLPFYYIFHFISLTIATSFLSYFINECYIMTDIITLYELFFFSVFLCMISLLSMLCLSSLLFVVPWLMVPKTKDRNKSWTENAQKTDYLNAFDSNSLLTQEQK